MFGYKIKNLYVVLTTLLIIFFTTGLSCDKKPKTTPIETFTPEPTVSATPITIDLTNTDPLTIKTIVENNFNLAKQKATEWKGDAQFYSMTVKLPPDLSLNNATETYVFGSESDRDYWWTIAIAESTNKYIRALIPKSDYLGNLLRPVAMDYLKTTYLQAFQVAENYQGAAYRTANNGTEVTITLSHGEPKNWLWWIVEYKSPQGNPIKIRVHPSDLQIYDDMGNIISSASVTSTPASIPPSVAPSPY